MELPRIRGEKITMDGTVFIPTELPPHTRRKASGSADHEKKAVNYLRIRGEKPLAMTE
ncbi:Hypothetical protein CulFRC58_0029 [Corynebacterium ulcerans FRC58]|uniref:Transposase n=2 Tax=Corynebacterium ulcerans TaxID=65058 RepID=A0ABM5TXR9_CORUL|nr:Hypothetical protein CulFRC58_0029 [Corynebacterium ulcerans FRC58]